MATRQFRALLELTPVVHMELSRFFVVVGRCAIRLTSGSQLQCSKRYEGSDSVSWLAVNQDSLGLPVRRLSGGTNQLEVWSRPLSDGAVAVALFNRTDSPQRARLKTDQLNLRSKPRLRDLWLHRNLGRQENSTCESPPHSCVMLLAK